MRHFLSISTLILTVLFMAPGAQAQVIDTHLISLDAAKQMAEAAEEEAEQQGWTVVVVVVDAAGDLILVHRTDGTQVGSVDVAIAKARTSVRYLRPTAAFQQGIQAGNNHFLTLDITAIEGGLPVEVDGQVIGAIGVSGVQPNQDTVVAEAGLAAFSY